MKLFEVAAASAVVAALLPAIAYSAPPSLDGLLRRPQYESLTLSPTGEFLAARVPLEDRTVLAIVRRSDMKITAQLDPGRDGFVESEFWVGDNRIFASTSMRFGAVTQPYQLSYLYSLDADGRNRRGFGGNVIALLDDDQEHVLVSDCRKVTHGDCWTRVRKVRTDGLGKPEDVIDAPVANAAFLADRRGNVRFAWATDDDDVQRAFVWRDGAWAAINDETTSGVEVTPLGTSYDGRHGYLWSEQAKGPDVIERIDFRSGERIVVASDPEDDPRGVIWSFDTHEPIGVGYGESPPKIRFFDEKHPHATLVREMEVAFPGEKARVTSATRDGRTALVTVTSDREPQRFYLLDTSSGDLSLLARSRPWLVADTLARMDSYTFKARDGMLLQRWLTRPVGATSDGSPLVVLPHGGPFGVRDTWNFNEEVQMLSARGYTVLQLNFRGSGGRGRDFIEAGYRQWGGTMQDDLTDATRWAIAQIGVDPKRICIWGTSYGGYAALMGAAREPDLYRCVIGVAGPYDLPTMYRWGDVQRSDWGEAYLKRTLGEDAGQLRSRSPTTLAPDIRAAVMLVQGGRDRRVSPEHVRAMKRALDAAGKEYDGYFPADETHGFFRDSSRREYYRRVLDFLGHHLDSTN